MTQHQYNIVNRLRRVWFLKRFFRKDETSGIVTKQAEIELAGQAAAKNSGCGRHGGRPSLRLEVQKG